MCRCPTQRWSRTSGQSTKAAKILQNLCKLPIKRKTVLPWPDPKKGSTQIPEQENPCTLHADFPQRRQNTSRDSLWNLNFNNNNFCSAAALTPKRPTQAGEGSRWWSWSHPAPEGTIPAGHSSLGRVGTSPNRNQNLPHCTHRAPWPPPPTSFCSLLLNPQLFTNQPAPAAQSPAQPSPHSWDKELCQVLSLPAQILPHKQQSKPWWLCDSSSCCQGSGDPSPPQSPLWHIPKLLEHRGTEGAPSCPSALQLCWARVPNLWMMTPRKHPLCSETESRNMKVFWLPLSTPSRLSPTASLTAAANALWMGRTWHQQPNALETELFYSSNTHHKLPGWLWKPGGLSSAQKGFSCAALFTQNNDFPEEKTN